MRISQYLEQTPEYGGSFNFDILYVANMPAVSKLGQIPCTPNFGGAIDVRYQFQVAVDHLPRVFCIILPTHTSCLKDKTDQKQK